MMRLSINLGIYAGGGMYIRTKVLELQEEVKKIVVLLTKFIV